MSPQAVATVGRRGWDALRNSSFFQIRPTSILNSRIGAHVYAIATIAYANAKHSVTSGNDKTPPFVLIHHCARYLSSSSSSSLASRSASPSHPSPNNSQASLPSESTSNDFDRGSDTVLQQQLTTTTISTSGATVTSNKGIFAKLWDRYSFQGQQKRIILGERLFRSAQFRANDL